MPDFMAQYTHYLICLQTIDKTLIDGYKMYVSNPFVLSPMRIMLIIDLYLYLIHRKPSLGNQVLDFEQQIFILDLFEFVYIDCAVGIYALDEQSVNYDCYEQKDVVIYASIFDYAKIAVYHRGYHNHRQTAIHEQTKYIAVYCLVRLDMLPLDEEDLVEVEGDHKSLFYEGINQTKPNCPLKLVLHVDYSYNLVDVVPDERDHICHEYEALEQSFDRKTQHFKGPKTQYTYNLSF